MNTSNKNGAVKFLITVSGAALASIPAGALAAQLTLSNVPLFLTSTTKPNVLVVYDNSQSMDATMAGKLIAGSDPNTRSNIARGVIRNTITTYRTNFRWGIMSFRYNGAAARYNTYAYYLGSDAGATFTDDCTGLVTDPYTTSGAGLAQVGVSASNGNRRCITNPQPFAGGNFITYDKTGDDPDVLDALYDTRVWTRLWGRSAAANSTNYNIYTSHNATTSWAANTFTGSQGTWGFTPTDAGYLPSSPATTRQFYLPRAWGYLNNITGAGTINQPVQTDSTAHYNALMARLADETNSNTSEIKNAALFTPLTGSLQSARTYFTSSLQGNGSPITDTCQKNFVILVTDGLPSGKTDGSLYSAAERTNTFSGGTWTWGTAVQDTINSITALRSTTRSGTTYDIQTYVVALGDGLQNAEAIAAMNAMAAAGGTGTGYMATSAASFTSQMALVSADIEARIASASALAVNSQVLTSETRIYQARFTSGVWSGQLLAFSLSGHTVGGQLWDGGAVLRTQPWDTGTDARQIITRNDTRGVPFRWNTSGGNALTASQQATLNTNSATSVVDSQGQARLDYLRGDCTHEGTGNNYRLRTTLNANPPPPCQFKLGDIANSAPAYVGSPSIVADATFRTTYANRPPMVYVGANDGMLHGFADANGKEKIAYAPKITFSNLNKLTSALYVHQYFVDGSPTVGDAWGVFPNHTGIGTCKTSGCWRTVLATGLAGGGKGIFALDVTDPTGIGDGPMFDEANADKLSLWEFTDTTVPNNMGYVYGQVSIVKMNNDRWAVIFGNGPNSVNENAVLYVVDIADGTLISSIVLNPYASATGNSNGLSSPAAFDANNDGKVDYIYAGDLRGNMWKIDVTSATPASWGSAYTDSVSSRPAPLFIATDADVSGIAQPITERPHVRAHPGGQTGQMIYFGTGRYIAVSDNAAASTPIHTFYGIWANSPASGSVTNAAVVRNRLLTQTLTTSGSIRTVTANTITAWGNTGTACNPVAAGNTCMGWKVDLLTATTGSIGEMSVFAPAYIDGVLDGSPPRILFTTLIPLSSACSYGGTSWLMELNHLTGGALGTIVFDINGDTVIDASDSPGGAQPVGLLSTIGIIPTPVVVENTAERKYDKGMSGSSGGTGISVQGLPVGGCGGGGGGGATDPGRKSWRQLQ